MMCPHCATVVRYDFYKTSPLYQDGHPNRPIRISYDLCPNCSELIVFIQKGETEEISPFGDDDIIWQDKELIFPRKSNIGDAAGIPSAYLEDYEEAIKVLSSSPKSSAALTRRLLQNILREEYKIKPGDLSQEIKTFTSLPGIPSHLTEAVDAIRNIGNFAAHPSKDKKTGEIVSVESGEAEWLIEIIEALFDFTFVQPVKLSLRKEELNIKLEKIGKPKMT